MTQTENLVTRLPNDIGGLPADPIVREEHEMEPWEKRCHALADVLDFHKIISTEEKRRGVEALGSEAVGKLSYYDRWIAAFAWASKARLRGESAAPELVILLGEKEAARVHASEHMALCVAFQIE